MTKLSSLDLLHQRVLQTMLDELPVDQQGMTVLEWLKLMLHRYKQKEITNE
jgi:hypothetical protein